MTDAQLATLIETQRSFDAVHATDGRRWDEKIDQQSVNVLLELCVALGGEFGEFANVVKSIARGDYSLDDAKEELSGELADVFIYVLKLARQLDIDLVAHFYQKVEANRERFRKFKIDNEFKSDATKDAQ